MVMNSLDKLLQVNIWEDIMVAINNNSMMETKTWINNSSCHHSSTTNTTSTWWCNKCNHLRKWCNNSTQCTKCLEDPSNNKTTVTLNSQLTSILLIKAMETVRTKAPTDNKINSKICKIWWECHRWLTHSKCWWCSMPSSKHCFNNKQRLFNFKIMEPLRLFSLCKWIHLHKHLNYFRMQLTR